MTDLNVSHTHKGLIGGIGMTRVAVYEHRVAPDGKHSGCPHIHAICAEAYYVISGKGYVELHNLVDGRHEVTLEAGTYFQFPPNTLHRLVNEGELVVMGIMSNAGLAENGDARIYFGPNVDADPVAYADAVALVSEGLEGALERRDHSVAAYQSLIALWHLNRDAYFAELKRFIELHGQSIDTQREKYSDYIANGPRAWANQAEALLAGSDSMDADQEMIQLGSTESLRFGICGILEPVQAHVAPVNIRY